MKHSVYKVWDNLDQNDPLKVTMHQAVNNSIRQRLNGGGLTFVLIDSMKDIEKLPQHVEKYYVNDIEVDYEIWLDMDVSLCREERHVVHCVDWTKDLDIENNNRLVFQYTNGSLTEKEEDTLIKVLTHR